MYYLSLTRCFNFFLWQLIGENNMVPFAQVAKVCNSNNRPSSFEGKDIHGKVYMTPFWTRANKIVKIIEPIVKVLWMGDKPTMDYIYETMDESKEKTKVAYIDIKKGISLFGALQMRNGTNNSIDLYMELVNT